jgi:hypothetical protein
MIIVVNYDYRVACMRPTTRTALFNAISNIKVQKLATFDRYAQADPMVPGLTSGQVIQSYTDEETVTAYNPTLRPAVGPAGPVSTFTTTSGCLSNLGAIISKPEGAVVDFYRQSDRNPISMKYCVENKLAYYSTLETYFNMWLGSNPISRSRLLINAITMIALEECTQPPVCPSVVASSDWLRPNNKFRSVDLIPFVSDQQTDNVTREITSCQSSESYNYKFGREAPSMRM